jgi:hypothetical protein
MKHDEYLHVSSEITELESILSELPNERVIERLGLEERLEEAKSMVADVNGYHHVYKANLTFRGEPVLGSQGIFADFAAKATSSFCDAVSAVAASLTRDIKYMGKIPERDKNQLMITGTAIGSFGFEFELPHPDESDLVPEPSNAERAIEKIQQLLQLSADGTDDEMVDVIDEVHPRAVKKVYEFLHYLEDQDAWCGLEYKNKRFRFEDIDQLRTSASRLQTDNIKEKTVSYEGSFYGVFAIGRKFEFKKLTDDTDFRGKIGDDFEDLDVLNREFLYKPAKVNFHLIQVGQGRPRYTLRSPKDISLLEE